MNELTTLTVQESNRSLVITLHRLEKHNALNRLMIDELSSLFGKNRIWPGVRSIVITGAGRSFCAGADLSMMSDGSPLDYDKYVDEGEVLFDLLWEIDHCSLPIIGRVNGSAFGGGVGILSCCDIVVAVENAMFSFSEVRLGLVPAVISPFIISKIGSSNARELFLTGERFDAQLGYKIGLIQQVVAEKDLDSAVAEKVGLLHDAAPGAQKAAKELIRTISKGTAPDIRRYLAEVIAERRTSEEGREGMSAFLEKRPPAWREEHD